MNNPTTRIFLLLCLLAATAVQAHHSFAVFDFETEIEFEGTVESLKFRNPHIEMTLRVMNQDGDEEIIHFIEGAPANMLVRNGIRPDMIKPGSVIWTTGSPLIEDPSKFFLRKIRTADGTEYGI